LLTLRARIFAIVSSFYKRRLALASFCNRTKWKGKDWERSNSLHNYGSLLI